MDRCTALGFVDDWVRACNAHDLERILSHFTDDVVFSSPVAVQLIAGSDATYLSSEANPAGATAG